VTERRDHWEGVYQQKSAEAVSWYAPRLETSLALLEAAHPGSDARVIDVGGGASTLPDHLLDRGIGALTVLDLSPTALERSRARLGERGDAITWIAGDVTRVDLPADAYDVWHDRAAFHFLTEPEEQARYAERLHRSLVDGGHVVLATFALDGPERCSGLPVQRYDPAGMARALGGDLTVVDARHERHTTPWGSTQAFQFAVFRKG
jgi:SAM-dependent methyltransferase